MSSSGVFAEYHGKVLPEWVDYNGHMNVAYYLLAFDAATDLFLIHLGLDENNRLTTGSSTFAAQIQLSYLREVWEGNPLRITTQLLGFDEKRIRFYHRMYHDSENYLAAAMENVSLHVNLNRRKVEPMSQSILDRLSQVASAHRGLDLPDDAGRGIERPALCSGFT